MDLTWEIAAIIGSLPLVLLVLCVWFAGRSWSTRLDQFELQRSGTASK